MLSVAVSALFVFGTLRDPEVLALVLGRECADVRMRAAWLDGHVAVTLPGEVYPVLQAQPGTRATGLLLEGLGQADFDRIAFFEGDEYAFEEAEVCSADGSPVVALVCATRSARDGARVPWTLEAWRERFGSTFLEVTRRYMALYGQMSAAQADAIWQQAEWPAGE